MNELSDLEVLKLSWNNPEEFWSHGSNFFTWSKPWTQILDESRKPLYRWFVGGEINVCYNLIDKNVAEGNGDKLALINESAATNTRKTITYNELLHQVSKFAGVLTNLNVNKEDVVFIYMPNIIELTIALLATFRIGAVAVIPLPNSSVNAIADRIELSKPKICVTTNCTKMKSTVLYFKKPLDEALKKLNYEAKVIMFQRPEFEPGPMNPEQDILWEDAMQSAQPVNCVPIESNDAAIVMYTSGSTGTPKGILYTAAGILTMITTKYMFKEWYFFKIVDVVMIMSHPGWISGIYATLGQMMGAACGVLLDGSASGNEDPGYIYRIISENKIQWLMLTTPALREMRLADPEGEHAKKYDLSLVASVNTAGENLDQLGRDWARKVFQVSLLEAWAQTEGPGAFESLLIMDNESYSHEERKAKLPQVGCVYTIFDSSDNEAPNGEIGTIAAKLPLPPHTMATLYKNDESYIKKYCSKYPGYINTKDLGWIDRNGFLHVVGREDDVIKVYGYRLTTTEIEGAILKNFDIAECVVVAMRHKEMYQLPVAFYTMQNGKEEDEKVILEKITGYVKEFVGPAACLSIALRVNNILKTQTGKIHRLRMQIELQNLTGEISGNIDANYVMDKMKEAATNLGML